MNEKEKLEFKIEKTAKEILSLKESSCCDDSEYKTLLTKMSDLIWRWSKIVFGEKTKNASVEIMKCIERSLKNFNGNDYIKYISVALRNEINNANKKNQLFKKQQISIPEKKQRKINSLLKYIESSGKTLTHPDDLKNISKTLNMEISEIQELLNIKQQSEILSDTVQACDGEVFSLTDSFVSEHNFTYNPETNFFINDENLEDEKKLEDLFCLIENLYLEEKDKTENQKTSKQYLGALITRQILEDLSKIPNLSQSKICRMLERKCFSDNTVLELFMQEQGNVISQQDIAEWYNKDKTDASRKINTFLRKLQEKMSTERIIDSSV